MTRIALLDWDDSLHRGLTLRGWTRHLKEHNVPPDVANAIEER